MIQVTKTFLPPLETYMVYLKRIWESGWVTNHGPLVQELEQRLGEKMGVEHALYVGNGTIALQLAIHSLKLSKEILTTPFSYVATTNAILWEHCQPRFVDINPDDCCINVDKIEAAITENTEAILAVHVYGIPCDLNAIEKIAEKHRLKVIYDAAHAFGVKVDGKDIAQFGDISTFSFHATKLFHTVEGGAITCRDSNLASNISLARYFGHNRDEYIVPGINGKSSEFHAAMGLSLLPHLGEFIARRRVLSERYDDRLSDLPLHRPAPRWPIEYNYAYYPVIFPSEALLCQTMADLSKIGVIPRRYFYPSLNRLPFTQGTPCPVSEDISRRILCLPLYVELEENSIDQIADQIAGSFRKTLSVGGRGNA
jgi:dTDP-4-amino-4,6-dideoxygalactose transaminase